MIKDYDIILGTMVSNMDLAGYTPVARAAIKSWSNLEYCDSVIIVDGKSVDDTVKIIQEIPGTEKVKTVSATNQWKPDSWTYHDIQSIESDCIQSVNTQENPNKIYMWLPVDTLVDDDATNEIYQAMNHLIETNFDFMNWGFRKLATSRYVSRTYETFRGWYMQSITKFQPNILWGDVHYGERSITTSRKISQSPFKFHVPPLCYDMFMFSKENIQSKIDRHCDIKNRNISVDDYAKAYGDKLSGRVGLSHFDYEKHPKEASDFLSKTTKDHFGHSLFGNEKHLKISY